MITHFEPWMALTFSEGSIGGDIERINLEQLRAFYEKNAGRRRTISATRDRRSRRGSNGIAIAPSNTTRITRCC